MTGFIFVLFVVGALFLYFTVGVEQDDIEKGLNQIKKRRNELENKYEQDEINVVMKHAGLPFSLFHYQMARWIILAFFVSYTIFNSGIIKEGSLVPLIFIVLFYVASMPVQTILRYPSPFKLMIDASLSSRRERFNEELYLAVSQMKNSFLIKKDRPPSSQMVLEEVRRYTDKTRHIFNRFMSFWQMGEKDMAVDYFEKAIGTTEAKSLSQVFLKLDELNPAEMRQQLNAFQDIYRTQRETAKKRKNEHKSNFLFVLVIGTCLLLMVNFLGIAFFIDFLKDFNELV